MNIQEKKQGHTELPWRTLPTNQFIFSGVKAVVDTDCREIGIAERLANAEFIVKACNSHDALVEALKNLQTLMEYNEYTQAFTLIKTILKECGE